MPNPMIQMLQQNAKSLNNPLAMLMEFRKFAAGMTRSGQRNKWNKCCNRER